MSESREFKFKNKLKKIVLNSSHRREEPTHVRGKHDEKTHEEKCREIERKGSTDEKYLYLKCLDVNLFDTSRSRHC